MNLDDLCAEGRLISAAMCGADRALELGERIRTEDFALPLYRILWGEVQRRAATGELLAASAITRDLEATGSLPPEQEEIAGLALIPDHFHKEAVIEDAITSVLDLARRRQLRNVGHAIAELAASAEDHVATTEAKALQRLIDLTKRGGRKRDTSIAAAVKQAMDEIKAACRGEDPSVALPWPSLQTKTLGLFAADLVIIAARPGVGKTVFGAQIAEHASRRSRAAQFRSLEMGAPELAKRYLSAASDIQHRVLRSGKISTPHEWDRLTAAATSLTPLPIEIDDESPITIADIQADAPRAHAAGRCDVLIVDYLQKVNGTNRYGRNGNRDQEVTEVAEGLKDIAKALRIPVVALAQLNRNLEKRGGAEREPIMSDLRESGGIEQAADNIWFLHRDEESGEAKVFVKKARNGELGTVRLRFNQSLGRCEDPAPEYREEERYR